MNSFLIRNW